MEDAVDRGGRAPQALQARLGHHRHRVRRPPHALREILRRQLDRGAQPERPRGALAEFPRHRGPAARQHRDSGTSQAVAAAELDRPCCPARRGFYRPRVFRRRASSAASASSQSRNVAIFGTLEVALGQTIQYVLDILKEISIGLTRRPLMRSHAASAVRASATPWPSTAASISMLARFRTGP